MKPRDRLQQIEQTRRALLTSDVPPDQLLHAAWNDRAWLLRSWQRCLAQGQRPEQPVSFDAVPAAARQRADEAHRSLLAAARPEMQRLAQQLPESPVVMAMYGCGDSIGPRLMAEIGDVRRFEDKRALVAYAGVDPQPSQSGKQNPKSNKISRKGAPGIRKALYQAMTTLLRKSPEDEPVYQFLDKMSTSVIKCKKTPVKKCMFPAERSAI